MNTACPSCLKRVGVRGGCVAPHFRAGSRCQTCSGSGAAIGKRGPGRPRKPDQVRVELRLPGHIVAELDRKRGMLSRADWISLALETTPEPDETVRERLEAADVGNTDRCVHCHEQYCDRANDSGERVHNDCEAKA